jgi:CspA family cold shock protein
MTGTVKWYDAHKGFGFITPDGGGPDVFVHNSVLPDGVQTLADGAAVEYDTQPTPRGDKVVSLTLK